MSESSIEPPLRRFSNLRSVRWRVDLGILPCSDSSSIDDLRRAAADSRRRYASLRRRLLIDSHLPADENVSSDLVIDNPLSQNPDSKWGRLFRNAELEKVVDEDLSRLYPEDGSYFQTPACQAMLRRILLLWCIRHPEYGYRQGMHELLAPLVYVLHVDLDHLSRVRKLHEDCFIDVFDGNNSFPDVDLISNYRFQKTNKWDSVPGKGNDSHESTPKTSSIDDLDPETKEIFLLSDPYGAEGELGIILSERFMEHDAYSKFDALMNGANDGVISMAEFFSPALSIGSSSGLPPIIEASSALYHLLSVVDSSLHSHFVELGVEPQYFALRWLRVLFGREFALDDLLLVWDELFASSNHMCIESNTEYSFKLLCSGRGAFIAALAVSMLLHLRSSLLATENATSCLQRLLNFPQNVDMKKLIEKAKALQGLALDVGCSSTSSHFSISKNNLAVRRGYSLPTGSASPKSPNHSLPDSYWEERWRVLHKEEALKKGNKSLGERFNLSRTESDPSPAKNAQTKARAPSATVRRRLFDDSPKDTRKSDADDGRSRCDENPAAPIESVSLSNKADREKQFEEEGSSSGENSSVLSATLSHDESIGNDPENESEKSSVTSNSFIGDNDEESCSQEFIISQAVQEAEAASSSAKAERAGSLLEKSASLKEKKPLSSKLQWLWKFGRASGEANTEKGGAEDSEKQSSVNNGKDSSCCSAPNGTCNSCEATSRRVDVGDTKVMGTLKNLGQSMLENIQ
ncbi:TBC1 domain family member 5 homolog A isoform X2 [Ananas comosus]|nr:TBC1 domain family member 5 homolog A isoform X2 [Ananas comosus]